MPRELGDGDRGALLLRAAMCMFCMKNSIKVSSCAAGVMSKMMIRLQLVVRILAEVNFSGVSHARTALSKLRRVLGRHVCSSGPRLMVLLLVGESARPICCSPSCVPVRPVLHWSSLADEMKDA